MRVLVVEDEHRVANYICQALIEEAFAVDRAADGLKGLDLATMNEYDAIVLDLMLPGLDGLTVCKRLRQAGKRTPVLILSARDMVDDRVRGLDAGADDYLIKPFAVEELAARLRALARRHQSVAAPTLVVGGLELEPSTHTVRQGGAGHSPHPEGVRVARVLHAASGVRAHTHDDCRARLGLHLRPLEQRCRRLRETFAGQDRPGWSTQLHSGRSRGGLCLPRSEDG